MRSLNSKLNIHKNIIIIILFFWIPLEVINGFAIVKLPTLAMGIKIIKLSIVLYLFYLVAIQTLKGLFYLLLAICLFVTTILISMHGTNDVYRTIEVSIKILTPILLIVIFYYYLPTLKKYIVEKALFYSLIFLTANLTLYFFNIGFTNYESGSNVFGGTGFLYAGNEVAGALICIYVLNVYFNFYNGKRVILVTLLAILSGVALASKTSIFGIIITLFIYLLIRAPLKVILSSFASAFIIPLYFTFFLNINLGSTITSAMERWSYFINLYGLETFLLGGYKRVSEIRMIVDAVKNDPMILIFGRGWGGQAENGLFDLIEAYGLLGLAIFFLYFYLLIFSSRASRFLNKSELFTVLSCLLIFTIAVMVGHFFQSTLTAPFFALLCMRKQLSVKYDE